MSYTHECKICGKIFETVGWNAKYCPECAKERKKQQDREAFLRKQLKKKEKDVVSAKDKKIIRAKKILAPIHAAELGIPVAYYDLWAKTYPDIHEKWMNEHITEEFLFSL